MFNDDMTGPALPPSNDDIKSMVPGHKLVIPRLSRRLVRGARRQ